MPIWGYFGSDQTPILPSSAQSVVLNYSCYCGVRIELACLFPGNTTCLEEWGQSGNVANLEFRLQTRLQSSLGREAKSLTGYPLSFPCGRRPLKQTNKWSPLVIVDPVIVEFLVIVDRFWRPIVYFSMYFSCNSGITRYSGHFAADGRIHYYESRLYLHSQFSSCSKVIFLV